MGLSIVDLRMGNVIFLMRITYDLKKMRGSFSMKLEQHLECYIKFTTTLVLSHGKACSLQPIELCMSDNFLQLVLHLQHASCASNGWRSCPVTRSSGMV
jgi:hypothetical protein